LIAKTGEIFIRKLAQLGSDLAFEPGSLNLIRALLKVPPGTNIPQKVTFKRVIALVATFSISTDTKITKLFSTIHCLFSHHDHLFISHPLYLHRSSNPTIIHHCFPAVLDTRICAELRVEFQLCNIFYHLHHST
jgi:hypothetical protein